MTALTARFLAVTEQAPGRWWVNETDPAGRYLAPEAGPSSSPGGLRGVLRRIVEEDVRGGWVVFVRHRPREVPRAYHAHVPARQRAGADLGADAADPDRTRWRSAVVQVLWSAVVCPMFGPDSTRRGARLVPGLRPTFRHDAARGTEGFTVTVRLPGGVLEEFDVTWPVTVVRRGGAA